MRDTIGSRKLAAVIREKILQSPENMIPFAEYMDCCLYEPKYGYYTSDRVKIGRSGDFYTSPSVGGLMGGMAASYIVDKLGMGRDGRELQIVEWGGGTGAMAVQLLDELRDRRQDVYAATAYFLVERSPHHRRLQADALQAHRGRVAWMDEEEWRRHPRRGNTVLFSNELLDAFPVHRVRMTGGVLEQLYVAWDENGGEFYETGKRCKCPELLAYIERESLSLSEGQTAELGIAAERWLTEAAAWLADGAIVTIDYGDTAEELYAAHRMNGTLLCYRRHQAADDPYRWVGEQDMTSHVNFSALIRAGCEAGMSGSRLMTQREFLVEAGILNLLQNHQALDPFDPVARRNRAVRQLLLSDGMSELFKVLVQTKKGD